MKILLVSDSHLYNKKLKRITDHYQGKVDLMVHCGDSEVHMKDPLMAPFDIKVRGNHDNDLSYPLQEIYQDILIVHGHLYRVYVNLDKLIEIAKQNNCTTVFYGHTHIPYTCYKDGIRFVSPGCIGINRGSYFHGTYAIIEDNEVHFYHCDTDECCDEVIKESEKLLHRMRFLQT